MNNIYRQSYLLDRDVVCFADIVSSNDIRIVNDLIDLSIYPEALTRVEREQINRVYMHYVYTSLLELTTRTSRMSILLHVHDESLKHVELSQWFESWECFYTYTIEQLLPDILKNIGINHIICNTSYERFVTTTPRGEMIDMIHGAQNRRTTSLRHFKKYLSTKGLTQLATVVSTNIDIHRVLS